MRHKTVIDTPALSQEIFGNTTPSVLEAVMPFDRWELLSVGYAEEFGDADTYLFAVCRGDTAELAYFSDGKFRSYYVGPSSQHHHISRLTDDPIPYADHLGVKEFEIKTSRNLELVLRRLPSWEVVEERDGFLRAVLRVGQASA